MFVFVFVFICLERGADLHMAQLMPLPLTVSCVRKVQIGFTFLVPAHLGSPRKGPLNVCVCACVFVLLLVSESQCKGCSIHLESLGGLRKVRFSGWFSLSSINAWVPSVLWHCLAHDLHDSRLHLSTKFSFGEPSPVWSSSEKKRVGWTKTENIFIIILRTPWL